MSHGNRTDDRAAGDSEPSNSIQRRSLLKGAAAGAASFVGMAGSASALTSTTGSNVTALEAQEATESFRSPKALENAFADHEHLLMELADDDLFQQGTVDELRIDSVQEPHPSRDGEGVTFTAQRLDGEVTPELRLFRSLPEGILTISVFPEYDHSYAIMNYHDEAKEPSEWGDGQITQAADTEGCWNPCDCQECGYVCCNCCPCSPCDQCFSCTCGMCHDCWCEWCC